MKVFGSVFVCRFQGKRSNRFVQLEMKENRAACKIKGKDVGRNDVNLIKAG
jgi:hypothetical protein